jgi:hypothetical protein
VWGGPAEAVRRRSSSSSTRWPARPDAARHPDLLLSSTYEQFGRTTVSRSPS